MLHRLCRCTVCHRLRMSEICVVFVTILSDFFQNFVNFYGLPKFVSKIGSKLTDIFWQTVEIDEILKKFWQDFGKIEEILKKFWQDFDKIVTKNIQKIAKFCKNSDTIPILSKIWQNLATFCSEFLTFKLTKIFRSRNFD